MSTPILLLLVAAAFAALWIWRTYNRLVRARNLVRSAWSDIDVQLQRRHDLIPRLVEAVRAYAGYERATLEAVTELRQRSLAADKPASKAAIEDALETATHRLLAVAESYPDLRASSNFLELQSELADTEDKLQYARRFYNGSVRDYNTRLQSFPDLLLARPLKFVAAEFFGAGDDAATAVRVQLDEQ